MSEILMKYLMAWLDVDCLRIWTRKAFDAVQIIINVMWLGLKSIAEEYPDFVRIKED